MGIISEDAEIKRNPVLNIFRRPLRAPASHSVLDEIINTLQALPHLPLSNDILIYILTDAHSLELRPPGTF